MVSQTFQYRGVTRGLVKNADSVDLGCGLSFWISDKFPGDANAVGAGPHRKQRGCRPSLSSSEPQRAFLASLGEEKQYFQLRELSWGQWAGQAKNLEWFAGGKWRRRSETLRRGIWWPRRGRTKSAVLLGKLWVLPHLHKEGSWGLFELKVRLIEITLTTL